MGILKRIFWALLAGVRPLKRLLMASFRVNILALLLVVGVVAGGSGYIVWTRPEVLGLKTEDVAAREEVEDLVTEVGKVISLPADEQPTVATVTDAEALSGQDFFKNSQNGDKVLIYTNAKKAVLYRQEEGIIIEVGSLNIKEGDGSGAEASTPKFLILNGTETPGLSQEFEKELTKIEGGVEVVGRASAAKSDYAVTFLVDLTGKNEERAKKLASALGVQVGPLPAGEKSSDEADFVLVVGADKEPTPTLTATPTPEETSEGESE